MWVHCTLHAGLRQATLKAKAVGCDSRFTDRRVTVARAETVMVQLYIYTVPF